jgi:hypothetical protein
VKAERRGVSIQHLIPSSPFPNGRVCRHSRHNSWVWWCWSVGRWFSSKATSPPPVYLPYRSLHEPLPTSSGSKETMVCQQETRHAFATFYLRNKQMTETIVIAGMTCQSAPPLLRTILPNVRLLTRVAAAKECCLFGGFIPLTSGVFVRRSEESSLRLGLFVAQSWQSKATSHVYLASTHYQPQ